MKPIYLNAVGIVSALGNSLEEMSEKLKNGKTALSDTDQFSAGTPLKLGLYNGPLPEITLPEAYFQSRNNRFALAALQQISSKIEQAIQQYGADRIGVVVGTSTSGISDSEVHLRQRELTGEIPVQFNYRMQEMGATAEFVAAQVGARGPVYGISTACSSGAKALASARRLIRSGICDAVIAGGVDTLCHLTVQGFSSLEAVSGGQCNPFSVNRDGINIGEAGALFLVSDKAEGVELAGVGESSDAHHISAPDPSGKGAVSCMKAALKDAGITPDKIGYINLHGTATPLNDQMESRAVAELFSLDTFCSSTKPFTGHTLGAAGALETGISMLALQEQFIPVHCWDGVADPELPEIALCEGSTVSDGFNYVLSNSFAFGGNNIALILRSRS